MLEGRVKKKKTCSCFSEDFHFRGVKKKEYLFFLFACERERGCPPTPPRSIPFHLFRAGVFGLRHGLAVVPPLCMSNKKEKNKQERKGRERERERVCFRSFFVFQFLHSLYLSTQFNSIFYSLPRLGPTQSPPMSLPGLMTTTGGTELSLSLSPSSFSPLPLSPSLLPLSPPSPPLLSTTPGTKS